MPDANGSQQVGATPANPPPTQAPLQTGSNQNPPPPPTNTSTNQQDTRSKDLQDIKRGEVWLIGIGIASVLVNVLLGFIYYQQLVQMRIATQASTEATRIANDSLQYSASQFDRSMIQFTSQSASAYGSTEATRKAANAATRALTLTQDQFARENRAYLIPVDTNLKGGAYGLVKISLRNYGHISARNAEFEGSLDRISATSFPAIQESIPVHLPVATVVLPSDVPTYTWDVFTPNYGLHFPIPGDALGVLGRITYDDGFGQKDEVGICYVFQVPTNQWELCGGDTSTYVKHQHTQ